MNVPTATMTALRILLAVAFLERLSHTAVRAVLGLHLMGAEKLGGLGMSPEAVHQLLGDFWSAAAFAPIGGAVLAWMVSPRLLLALGLAVSAAGQGLLAATPAIPFQVPLSLLVIGEGLSLPGLYLTLARHFVARQVDWRDAAFALLLVFMGLGSAGALLAGLHEDQVRSWFFVVSALPLAAALAAVRLVRDPGAMEAPAVPGAAAKAGIVLLACLALEVLGSPRQRPWVGGAEDAGVFLWLLISEAALGSVFGLAAAFLWIRRDRRDPRTVEATKIGLAAIALALGLVLWSFVDQRTYIFWLGAGAFFGFYRAWAAPVALSVAASVLPGRRAGIFLALWFLAAGLATWLPAGFVPRPWGFWLAAAGSVAVGGLLFAFRSRLRLADPGEAAR